jgi:hypothetical protein
LLPFKARCYQAITFNISPLLAAAAAGGGGGGGGGGCKVFMIERFLFLKLQKEPFEITYSMM